MLAVLALQTFEGICEYAHNLIIAKFLMKFNKLVP